MSGWWPNTGLLGILLILLASILVLTVPIIGFAASTALAGTALAFQHFAVGGEARDATRVGGPKPYVLWVVFWLWLTATPGVALLLRHDLYLYSAVNVLMAVLFVLVLMTRLLLRTRTVTRRTPLVSTVLGLLAIVAVQSLLQSPLHLGPRALAVWGALVGIGGQVGFVALAVRYAPISADLLRDMTRGVVVGGTLTVSLLVLMGGVGAGRFGVADVLHPNSVGGLAAIGFLGALSAGRHVGRFTRLIGLTALPAAMVLSLSKTSLIACVASIAIWLLMSKGRHRGYRALLLISSALVMAFIVGDEFRTSLTSYLADAERVETLSERTVLWTATLERSAERPIRGFGFATFPDALAAPDNLGWDVYRIAHAHNAYLTVLLEQGYVGLGLFAGLIITSAVLLVRVWHLEGRNQIVIAGAAIFTFLLVRSITEGALAMRSDFAYLCAIALMFEARLARTRNAP